MKGRENGIRQLTIWEAIMQMHKQRYVALDVLSTSSSLNHQGRDPPGLGLASYLRVSG